jgi:hypothetical protein
MLNANLNNYSLILFPFILKKKKSLYSQSNIYSDWARFPWNKGYFFNFLIKMLNVKKTTILKNPKQVFMISYVL